MLLGALLFAPLQTQASEFFSFDRDVTVQESTSKDSENVKEEQEPATELESPIVDEKLVSVYYPLSEQDVKMLKYVQTDKTVGVHEQKKSDSTRYWVLAAILAALLVVIIVLGAKRLKEFK